MTTNAKPYRLITDAECRLLQSAFELKLADWNAEHALFPLTCALQRAVPFEQRALTWIADETGPLVLLLEPDYSTLKQALLGDASECFDAVITPLFLALLTQLLGKETFHLEIKAFSPTIDDWFYSGSPALTLTLSQGGHHMALALHPKWVLSALQAGPPSPNALTALDDALDSVSIDLNVELNAIPLKLKDMMGLQVGDVIQSAHPITTPVVLNHDKHRVCGACMGESHTYKSIQITSTS